MEREKYLFSGVINCLECGNKFRGKKARGVPYYLCSGNSQKGNEFCPRFTIKESELLDLINSHFDGQVWNINHIKSIDIKNQKIVINYKDNEQSVLSGNHYKV